MLQYLLEADMVARISTKNVSDCYVANYVGTIMFAFISLFQFLFCRLYKGHDP